MVPGGAHEIEPLDPDGARALIESSVDDRFHAL
jgi:hypothetical protein